MLIYLTAPITLISMNNTNARNTTPAEIGDFITVTAWKVYGQIIATRPASSLGSEEAIEVLLETRPDDPRPRWYRLEPDEYVID